MKKRIFTLIMLAMALLPLGAQEQKRYAAYEEYIAEWRDVAQEHESLYGIPAAISLAQGLLESNAGQSELAQNAHNHFGIKCTSDWLGGSYYYDDDRKGECFRVYGDAAGSWEDHAKFLRRDRYKSCFEIPTTDYAAWAKRLKECGYATDPNYPQKLIRIIETYGLAAAGSATEVQEGSKGSKVSEGSGVSEGSKEEDEDFFKGAVVVPQPESKPLSAHEERKSLFRSHPRKTANGHRYIIAREGDTYASLAYSLNVRERELRLWNDALGRTLHPGDRVYCMGYKRNWISDDRKAVMWVHPGESVWQVSQREGIREKKIRKLNGFGDEVDIFKTRQKILLKRSKEVGSRK